MASVFASPASIGAASFLAATFSVGLLHRFVLRRVVLPDATSAASAVGSARRPTLCAARIDAIPIVGATLG